MKNLFFCLLLLAITNTTFSQDYKTGIGLRGGWTSGLTAKHFIKEDAAIEGIFSSGWRRWTGYQITVLYEKHKAAFTSNDDIKGFFWFYGAGVHFATGYTYEKWYDKPGYGYLGGYHETYHYSAFGIDGIFGLEYKIEEVPITVGIDVKPFIEIPTISGPSFGFWDMGLSIRYVF